MISHSLNLHHLELFYAVAKAGGITAATRHMGYGIQQPAVSAQISALEKDLGVRLFQRRPFQLTPAGLKLYDFLAPFFSRLPEVAREIAGNASRTLRIAAPTAAIREHFPAVIAKVRRREPKLELSVNDVSQKGAFLLLEREEIDLAIVELEGKPPAGTSCEILAKLPLVMLLPAGVRWPRGGLRRLACDWPLIQTPADTAVSRLFEKGLAKQGLHWKAAIEVSTTDLVNAYVEHGLGCGVSVEIPGMPFPEGVTAISLKGFPKLVIAALWRGEIHALAKATLEELRGVAESLGIR